jgi:hypothetical protein
VPKKELVPPTSVQVPFRSVSINTLTNRIRYDMDIEGEQLGKALQPSH